MISDEQLQKWRRQLGDRNADGAEYYALACLAVSEVVSLRAIVRDLAACDPVNEHLEFYCNLCLATAPIPDCDNFPNDSAGTHAWADAKKAAEKAFAHAESCPYRRACEATKP